MQSIIDYACTMYGSASETNLANLDPIQGKSLRLPLESIKSSSFQAVLVEERDPPLFFWPKYLTQKQMIIKYFLTYLIFENSTNKYRINNRLILLNLFQKISI